MTQLVVLDFYNSSSIIWTVDSRLVYIIQCSYIIIFFLNKTIRMYYSLFVFRFYYKMIGLSFKKISGPRLTNIWPGF